MTWKDRLRHFAELLAIHSAIECFKTLGGVTLLSSLIGAVVFLWKMVNGASQPEAFNLALTTLANTLLLLLTVWAVVFVAARTWSFATQPRLTCQPANGRQTIVRNGTQGNQPPQIVSDTLANVLAFFIGRWRVGDPNRPNRPYFIYFRDAERAERLSRMNDTEARGPWHYANGEATIVWDDDWTDTLRCTPFGEMIKLGRHRSKPGEPDVPEQAVKET